MNELYALPLWATTLIVAGSMVVVAVILHALVQRRIPYAVLIKHNDVAGFILSVIGVLYAVMLAFVVIAVWEDWNRAGSIAQEEVSAVGDLYRMVRSYPAADRERIRHLVVAYVRTMSTEEWPAMQAGQDGAPHARRLAQELTAAVEGFRPINYMQLNRDAQSLGLVQRFLDARRERLSVNARGIPSLLWWALIEGAVLTIGFTFLFGTEHARAQLIMTAVITAVIGVMLVVILEMEYPFRGAITISSDIWQRLETALTSGQIK